MLDVDRAVVICDPDYTNIYMKAIASDKLSENETVSDIEKESK